MAPTAEKSIRQRPLLKKSLGRRGAFDSHNPAGCEVECQRRKVRDFENGRASPTLDKLFANRRWWQAFYIVDGETADGVWFRSLLPQRRIFRMAKPGIIENSVEIRPLARSPLE